MRAAVTWGVGDEFDVRDDVERRSPGPDEVVVAVKATGVCQTDLSLAGGSFGHPLPAVFGHEGAGVVIEVGQRVSSVVVGQHVVINWVPACDRCFYCRQGNTNHCLNRRSSSQLGDVEPPLRARGTKVSAGMSTATFAQECVLPAGGVVPLDPDVPFGVGSLFGCSVTTGVGAALNSGQVRPGQSVLVLGCGPIGVNAIQGARIAGAAVVAGVDPLPARRGFAQDFGADVAVDPADVEELRDLTPEGVGFDCVIDAVGAPNTMATSWALTRKAGRLVMVGAGRPADEVSFNAYELFHGEKTVVGSYYGATDLRREVPTLTALWRSKRLVVDPFTKHESPLQDINEVVAQQRGGGILRKVLIP